MKTKKVSRRIRLMSYFGAVYSISVLGVVCQQFDNLKAESWLDLLSSIISMIVSLFVLVGSVYLLVRYVKNTWKEEEKRTLG